MTDLKQELAQGAKQVEFRAGQVSFQLVRIPAGEFEMGSPASEEGREANEGPAKRVRISKAFYLGPYEVTQAQYRELMGENPSLSRGDTLAVDQIVYAKALEFCVRLSQQAGVKVELPTEAQWEYACRAGTKTRYYSGETRADLDRVAWHKDNAGGTVHPVGQKQPNAWGLYDMLGNVWELTADYIQDFDKLADIDPKGLETMRWGAMRGGAWMELPNRCRSASRLMSNNMFGGAGIRIAIQP